TELYTSTVNNYQRLLDAENRKFGIGESSLFLLNSRESKLIESQQKLIELTNKNALARIKFLHATGNLFEKYQ
ncbi:MAG: TolC family protein, partial [Flavobacteriales bacterium]